MKKISTLIVLLCLVVTNVLHAQTDSKGFSFQGYALDPDGKALGATNITVKFSIYKYGTSSASNNTYSYMEETALTTDAFGVFATTIGTVSPDDFMKLDFTAKNTIYNLKVEVKKTSGGTYTTISNGNLLSVPYARAAANGVPVGSIIPFGGPSTAIPDGWLPCDGKPFSTTDARYSQLYAVIGNAWGGSGTTFNVPELRGYFLRGLSDGESTDPDKASRTALKTGGASGDNIGSYQDGNLQSHTHTNSVSTDGSHTHQHYDMTPTDGGDLGWGSKYAGNINKQAADGDGTSIDIFTNTTTASGDHSHTVTINNTGGNETRPKNAYVWFIIKY